MIAIGNVDVYLSPGGKKVGYFVPGQKFTFTGRQEGEWIEVRDSDDNKLWIKRGSPYGPVGKVTPVPKTPVPKTPEPPKPPVTPVPMEILRQVGWESSRYGWAPDRRDILGSAERVICVDSDFYAPVQNDPQRRVVTIVAKGMVLDFYYGEGAALWLFNTTTVEYITFQAQPSELFPPGWQVLSVRVHIDAATGKVTGILVYLEPE